MRNLTVAMLAMGVVCGARADLAFWNLASSNFSQDWSDLSLINANDDWSGVPSIIGYRGDDGTTSPGVDPQTVLQDLSGVVDVNANQTNPDAFTTGGVTEFATTDPTIALTGSGTADAPNLVISINAAGRSNVTISYDLIDLEFGTDNAVQQVALQYRLGTSGNFTNVPSAYVADASQGPSIGGLVTPISVSLGAWDNANELQFRILTTNAPGTDEWIGVDNIVVSSVPEPGTMAALALGAAAFARRRRSK